MARILRLPTVLDRTGDTRSPFYQKTADGTFTKGVKLGGSRAVGWPEHEVEEIICARIRGDGPDALRKLVQRLHEARLLAQPLAA